MPTQQIPLNLKAVRQRAGLSLSQAAQLTGVSKAMLGQIERGESSPTLATLWKLATGFHLPLSAFIEDLVLTQPQASTPLRPPAWFEEEIRFRSVFPFDPVLGSETFVIWLAPGKTHLSAAHDSGVIEDLFVIEGTLELMLDEEWTLLQSGEAQRFAADVPHGYRNLTDQPAQFHNTILYPKTGLLAQKPAVTGALPRQADD